MGDLSPHFSQAEFRCHHCGRLIVNHALVARLELLRARIGKPLPILSGYRCAEHNRAVGGARDSRHVHGDAADFKKGLVRLSDARKVGFRGIGHCAGWVVHVDIRPGSPVEFKDC